MSYFKTNNIMGKLELSGFDGIDLSTPGIDGKCTDMVNLRILPDRSMIKRDGFRELFDFGENIRAVLSGDFDGEFYVFVVAGSAVYRFDPVTCKATSLGAIQSCDGDVSIFYYMGKVYVLDGLGIFEVRGNTLMLTEGYAPLVGKEWGSNYPGEPYESLNALTPKGRISYIVDDPPTAFLSTYYEVKEVNAVYVNGTLRSSDTYGLDHRLRALNVSGLEAGDKVLVYYTFASDFKERARVVKNPHAMVFGGINNSRVFMWGGEEKSRMFVSTPVSKPSLEEAERVFTNCGGLYFPERNDFCVGDGMYGVRAVSRHYDRLLIFTSGETWMADSEVSSSQSFPLTRINTDVGCASLRGVAKCGNDPISVGHRDIFRWTSNTDTLEDCNAYVISDKIKDALPDSFFANAVVFADRHSNEVLFSYKEGAQSRIFVYSIPTGQWYIYNGLLADHFFEGERSLGFASGSKLCIFERGRLTDSFMDGRQYDIYAYATYSQSSFGHPTRKKRIAGVMGIAELRGGELDVSFESDKGNVTSLSFDGNDPGRVECFYKRIRSERFWNSRMKISIDPKRQQRIYSLTVSARA